MEKFLNQMESVRMESSVKHQRARFNKEIKTFEKIVGLNELKRYLEQTWGIQRGYRSKKEYLQTIGMMVLRKRITEKTKLEIINEFLYEEKIPLVKRFYTKNKSLSSYQKNMDRKLITAIVKDCYKKETDEILIERCGFPFSFRAKETIVDLILMSVFEKPTYTLRSCIVQDPNHDCTICSSQVNDEGVAMDCECPYFYHKECLEKWLSINPSCPTCRKLV